MERGVAPHEPLRTLPKVLRYARHKILGRPCQLPASRVTATPIKSIVSLVMEV
jgi:hypothetical protein